MAGYKIQQFSKTRIATIDICAIGKQKHHIAAMLELDVSESRGKIRQYRRKKEKISFIAWLIKVISLTIKNHERVAGYLRGKRKAVIFNDINVSIIVEKVVNGQKVPIPLILEKANERSIESITSRINEARTRNLNDHDIVLHKRSGWLERFYYNLPGFIRRSFWRYLLHHPDLAYSKMGNVSVTSVGMMGNASGWFIPVAVHPACFGIGKIKKKPVVIEDRIEIREILYMTVLLDHDVIDGAPMARFISDLSENIEKGMQL